MPTTASVPVGQLQLLVPLPPLTVDGIPGQLDLVTAIHAAAPQPCGTCRRGCDCDGSPERPGCGHSGCWGRGEVTAALPACPGIAYERARAAVMAAGGLQLKAARRRNPATYRRVVAALLTDAGLAVTDD